jgi:hypothetical protein
MAINSNQWQSTAINSNQWQSMAIKSNPWQSTATNGHQQQSMAISSNPRGRSRHNRLTRKVVPNEAGNPWPSMAINRPSMAITR